MGMDCGVCQLDYGQRGASAIHLLGARERAGLAVTGDAQHDRAVLALAAVDRTADGPRLPGHGSDRILLLDAVLHLRVETVPLVVLADPGPVVAVWQSFPADIVRGRTDMLLTCPRFMYQWL